MRLHRYFAIEAAYHWLGKFDIAVADSGVILPATARARSYGAALVGILPVDRFDLYARAGYARTEVKSDSATASSTITGHDRFNEAYYGAGVRWNVNTQVGLFAEYQRNDKLELDAWYAGMQWRF